MLHFKRPLITLHFKTPLKTLHFKTPLKTLHFKTHLKTLHFKTPLKTLHFKTPLKTLHFKTPLITLHFKTPFITLHFKTPLKTLHFKTLSKLKLALTPELNNLSCWLKAKKLSLNVAKTELMTIGSRQRLSAQCDDSDVEIRIDDQIIKRVDHTKYLGLTIDAQLSWGKHVEEICNKVSSTIGVLKRVRSFISKETAIQIYNALIMPHFDYCSSVWDCLSDYLSDKLQTLQNRAARVITKSSFDASSNHLLSTLSWERLSLRRKKQKALMMCKTVNDLAPEYLQSLFSQRHSAYNLRNSEGRLTLSKPSTNYLKPSFSYSGAMLWNNLPKN